LRLLTTNSLSQFQLRTPHRTEEFNDLTSTIRLEHTLTLFLLTEEADAIDLAYFTHNPGLSHLMLDFPLPKLQTLFVE